MARPSTGWKRLPTSNISERRQSDERYLRRLARSSEVRLYKDKVVGTIDDPEMHGARPLQLNRSCH
jgi:hypothetical protein